MAMTAIRARSRPYSTMLAPRSLSVLNLAWIQVLRTKRSMSILLMSAPEALHFPAALAPCLRLDDLGIGRKNWRLHRPIDSIIGRHRRSVEPDDAHSHGGEHCLGAVPGV